MSVPQKCRSSLAKVLRQNGDRMKNLSFPPGITAVTAVQTADLRFDVHPSTNKEGEATGIIQANSQATNKEIKKFIKRKSGGHKGTHQVIDKIRFPLGSALNVEALAQAIETPGAEYTEASGSGSVSDNLETDWSWSVEHQQIWRTRADGSTEWRQLLVPEGESMYEWQYSKELRLWYRYNENETFTWQ
jgi:hypothetical protein